jgi:DNA topoisomerase IB
MRILRMPLSGLLFVLLSVSICLAAPKGRSQAFVTRTFTRVTQLRAQLPRLTQQMRQRLTTPALDKATATAIMFELMRQTGMRVGEPAYAKARSRTNAKGETVNTPASYGASTLRAEHVVALDATTGRVQLQFDAKGNKPWTVQLNDPLLAKAMGVFVDRANSQTTTGGSLFATLNARSTISSELAKVNAKPHDLRRSFANNALENALKKAPHPKSREAAVESFKSALEQTQVLMRHSSSNTTKSYIDPSLPARFFTGLTLGDI